VTKLLEILVVRAMADAINASSKPHVIVNCLTPGVCKSDFFRESTGVGRLVVGLVYLLIARSSEVGSRTLVAAGAGGEETHGKYMADSHVARYVEVDESSKEGKH
jgi:retinol dehydrogenase-12